MDLPSIYEACTPREDVLSGRMADSDFAADLAQVLKGEAAPDYQDPARFFGNTYPTKGLRTLLECVCARLGGSPDQVGSIFRLDTNYGGGKTHALIALTHLARGRGRGIADLGDFVDPALVPGDDVTVAAYDGENADTANGRDMGDGVRAFTPWGELAYQLAGREGYESVRRSDERGIAPGAENIRALFGGRPVLILMDELSVALRKMTADDARKGAEQLAAFVTGLFKAVESAPRAALVYTLALGKGGKASGAYGPENEKLAAIVARAMEELSSISARKATLLDPTTEDETVQVLRRRLFGRIDEDAAGRVADAYATLWRVNDERLPAADRNEDRRRTFLRGYPLHPELIDTLTTKTSTLEDFQRVRGMLRILARTVARLWEKRPAGTYAVHAGHVDLSYSPIRQEFLTKLGMTGYAPAIKSDIAAAEGDSPALAERLDKEHYGGLQPYASLVARTVFLHSLAYNDALQGANPYEINYSVLAPGMATSLVADAVRRFRDESGYLDDRRTSRLRFLKEANLTQVIRQQERRVDSEDVRRFLKDGIRNTFKGSMLDAVFFPGNPGEVDDRADKPKLVVPWYEAVSLGTDVDAVPDMVRRIAEQCSEDGRLRMHRNNVVFVVADEGKIGAMKDKMRHRIALQDIADRKDDMAGLADHQRNKLQELRGKAAQEAAIGIQQAYRHVFYPARNPDGGVPLRHGAVEIDAASDRPGNGQSQVVGLLRKASKLRVHGDAVESPDFVIGRTPLQRGEITTGKLWEEYKDNPGLAILADESILVKIIVGGIDEGKLFYVKGDLVYGKGDPRAAIEISDQALVTTRRPAPPVKIDVDFGEETLQKNDGTITTSRLLRECEAEYGKDLPSGSAMEHAVKDVIARGVGEGRWTYRDGESVYGKGDPLPEPEISDRTSLTAVGTKPGKGPDTGGGKEPPLEVHRDGILKEAVTRIWEDARKAGIESADRLEIQVFAPEDAFALLGPMTQIPGDKPSVTYDGSYETPGKGICAIKYAGPPQDAGILVNFLRSQFRTAKNSMMEATFVVEFPSGLSTDDESARRVVSRIVGIGAGFNAFVKVSARKD